MIFLLKPGKDLPLPSSYKPISLLVLDTVGKHFEKIMIQNHSRSQLLRPSQGRAVWISTQAQHDPPVGLISWTSQKKFWREAIHLYSLLGCGYSFRFCWDRRYPFQANHPRIPILPGEINHLLPTLLHLHGKFSGSPIFLSPYVGWNHSGESHLSSALQSICWHSHTLPPHRIGSRCR